MTSARARSGGADPPSSGGADPPSAGDVPSGEPTAAGVDDLVRVAPSWFGRNLGHGLRQESIDVEGADVHLLRWGVEGDPLLVLVHGGGAHARWWAPIAPFFVADGWQVAAVDLSGHGDSGHRERYDIEQWGREIDAVIGASVADRCVVIGHSLGSHVAVVAAAQRPGASDGTILVDFGIREPGEESATRRRYRHQISYRSREEAIDRFRIIPRQPCRNQYYVDYLAEHSVRREGTRWRWKFDVGIFGRSIDRYLGDYLSELDAPVVFIPGEESRLVPPVIIERGLRLLGRPAPVVAVPGADHHVWIDEPLAFVSAVRGVLASWWPRHAVRRELATPAGS